MEDVSTAELLRRMRNGWGEFNVYLKTLTPEQLTVPTDAAGWTAKDHIAHLAVWEDGIYALLQGQSRREQMGLQPEIWEGGDYDRMNAVIQQQHQNKSLDEVLKLFTDVHERLVKKIQSLSDEDLLRPYRHYQPESTADKPVIGWIVGNTYEHYAEHRPWIETIAQKN